MNVFVFDIETVPDVQAGRRLYGLHNLSDAEVAEVMFNKRRQESGSEFLRPHVQRVVSIAVLLRSGQHCKVWSLGNPEAPEEELIKRFFDGIDKYTPTLVSWNGGGFRSAGAALPGLAARHSHAALLGNRRYRTAGFAGIIILTGFTGAIST